MTDDADRDEVTPGVATVQIINVCLVAGVLLFLGMSIVLRSQHPDGVVGPAAPDANRILPIFAVLLAAANALAAFWIPKSIIARRRRDLAEGRWIARHNQIAVSTATDAGRLLSVYTTARIVQLALIEGAAFFCLIVYFLQGSALMLAMAILLAAGMVVGWPSRTRLDAWLAEQSTYLNQERPHPIR